MPDIDQAGEARLRLPIEGLGRLLAAAVLSDGDDLETCILHILVKGLPPGQVVATASPGGPGEEQHLLAAKLGQPSLPTLEVR